MNPLKKTRIDLIGKQFTHLTVIDSGPIVRVGKDKQIKATWKCRCICGVELIIQGQSLRSGNTKSCGCLGNRKRKVPREYKIWRAMIDRCHNPNNSGYHKYGMKGVRVYWKWRNSFDDFIGHIGPCPSFRHSIDRYPDNQGNYKPGNVRWATPIEQAKNKVKRYGD